MSCFYCDHDGWWGKRNGSGFVDPKHEVLRGADCTVEECRKAWSERKNLNFAECEDGLGVHHTLGRPPVWKPKPPPPPPEPMDFERDERLFAEYDELAGF